MSILTKDQILSAEDLLTETVEVPEWSGSVIVMTMMASARDQLEASIIGKGKTKNLSDLRAKIVALSVVNEDKVLLFSFDDVVALGKKSARALDRVFSVAQRLSGFTPGDMEEMAGNSSSDRNEDSISG